MTDLITIDGNGEPVTTSLLIAEGCGNSHEAVIKLVRKYKSDIEQFGPLEINSRSSGGLPTKYAVLNERQASLVLTYLRNNAIVREFKISLINAFYQMRDQLRQPPKQEMSLAQITLQQAQILVEQENRISAIEHKVEQMSPDTGYRTIVAHCREINVHLPRAKANLIGRQAAKLCKERGLTLGHVPDERWGSVNSYPVDVLSEVLPGEMA